MNTQANTPKMTGGSGNYRCGEYTIGNTGRNEWTVGCWAADDTGPRAYVHPMSTHRTLREAMPIMMRLAEMAAR